MNHRVLAVIRALMNVIILMVLAQVLVAAQTKPTSTTPAKAWSPTKTAWGDPDLQGVYTFATDTPLQRPAALGNKDTYTPEELAEVEKQAEEKLGEDIETNEHFSYNKLWFGAGGRLTGRTSLIVDPENGRMPPMTERAQKLRAENQAALAKRRIGKDTLINTWEDHPIFTRCIARPYPRIFQEYNHGVEILQTPGQVVLFYESMHDVRVIPLDGRPHLDKNVSQWMGDSRGHWEGDTLVVDWTNFPEKLPYDGSYAWGPPMGNMHFTERFTKADANTVNYVVTIDDPLTWTKPWTFILPWRSDDSTYSGPEDLYEYACHEGNFRMMEDTLTGSRALKEAQSTK